MTRYAYYPGCSLEMMASEYDASFRNACHHLGIELEEPRDWICCGAGMLANISPLLELATPLKNIALAKATGHSRMVAPCSACFHQFKNAQHAIAGDAALRSQIEEIVEHPLDDPMEITHPLELFAREMESRPRSRSEALAHLRVACYYGCLLTRPPKVMQFDDCEDPRTMERLLAHVGVETVEWTHKTSCCGAFYAMVDPSRVLELTAKILAAASEAGANAIAVACPVCHINLDARQSEINQAYGTKYDLPVFYFTQLLALAFGIDQEGLGLWRHVVDPQPLLCRAALAER